jgi:ribosomal protein S18 acetylase RimI-like enzyme
MAALPESPRETPRPTPPVMVVEMARITAAQLEPVLQEEAATWLSTLSWDFQPSAELVRRFVNLQALSGFALMHGGEVVGYAYFVSEEGKGLIGDLYVLESHRTRENEHALLDAVLDALRRTPGIRRVEAQLMMLQHAPASGRAYARCFYEADLSSVPRLPARPSSGVVISSWGEYRQEETARLIAFAYASHIDSQINDQYRSAAGARRFLMNIVQYPGCGVFFAPASFAASGLKDHLLCGVCLASRVAPTAGHITQVCIAPSWQGCGLGYELLRRSMLALAGHGCRLVSLTVTESNRNAIELYERMGFYKRRDFSAYVWE